MIYIFLLGFFAIILVFFLSLFLYARLTLGKCELDVKLNGKTVIITGANSGVGFETTKDFARRGARVIMACRNLQRGQTAREAIIKDSGNENVILKECDMSLMASVRKFASEILKEESRLDILVNNAGLTSIHLERTSEGMEKVMASNHFGHFLLTNLLIDLLKESAPSRIVNVSSIFHKFGQIDFDNLNSEKEFNVKRIYSDSKLANCLFTVELSERFSDDGVTSYSLHPGVVASLFGEKTGNSFLTAIYILGKTILPMKSPEEGAQTTIYCALTPGLEKYSGRYFSDCQLAEESSQARDAGVAKKLWEASERLTGLTEGK